MKRLVPSQLRVKARRRARSTRYDQCPALACSHATVAVLKWISFRLQQFCAALQWTVSCFQENKRMTLSDCFERSLMPSQTE